MKNTAYIGKTTRIPFLHCPVCGHLVDGMTSVSQTDVSATPTEGAVTVCLYCASMLIVEHSFAGASPWRLRLISKVERVDVKRNNPGIAALLDKLQRAAREMVNEQRRGQG